MTTDLAARKILVAAYIYYVLDDNIMSDDEYDKLSIYVADHWDELSEARQWALGDAESTRASGSHFKFTMATVGSAYYQLEALEKATKREFPTQWTYDFEFGRYRTAAP